MLHFHSMFYTITLVLEDKAVSEVTVMLCSLQLQTASLRQSVRPLFIKLLPKL